MAKKDQTITPLPFPVYFWTVALLAFSGLLVSLYLSISHYRVYTDIGYRSFCAVSKSINCDTVSQSSYSIFLDIPVPVWGVVGYAFFLLFLPFAWLEDAKKERMWPILFLLSLGYSVYSIVLALISSLYIHSYCIMCIASYGINFMLLYYTWLVGKRFGGFSLIRGIPKDIHHLYRHKKRGLVLFLSFFILLSGIILAYPKYWDRIPAPPSPSIAKGVTDEGYPWIGAEDPVLTIIEFSDYQCFQCGKMHFFLRKIVEKNPDKIRLVHRHFPMDHNINPIVKNPYHVGSGELACFSILAGIKGKFWKMNDLLFDIARKESLINTRMLADKTGLNAGELARSINHPYIRQKLKKDIFDGMKLRVTGTPTFFINGKKYSGYIPPEILADFL
ncbi:MAG: vitamin K epoxide reductase family protein [Desulfobacterales bacterium]